MNIVWALFVEHNLFYFADLPGLGLLANEGPVKRMFEKGSLRFMYAVKDGLNRTYNHPISMDAIFINFSPISLKLAKV